MILLALATLALCKANPTSLGLGARQTPTNETTSRPLVNLGYATYEGISLANDIDQFLGMRYAAPPIGDLRFRRPADPLNKTGILDATQHGPVCYGVTNPNNPESGSGNFSEDCLFIDVYTPANASIGENSSLPVLLWIQGGAFVELINPNYNGTGLIEASKGNVIVVTFNYRVGPFGFLATEVLAAERNLNVGLHDQRAAITWVQNHIHKFGGNPNHLTLFGTSIGGGSVLMQLLAYGGDTSREPTVNWTAGIAESVYVPSVYTVEQMEFQYENLLNATNCSNITCLRSLPVEELQNANVAIPFPGQAEAPLFGYGPVIDGGLIPDRPLNLLKQNKFLKDKPLIIGSSRTEGTIFAPQANTSKAVDNFIKTQLPGLEETTLQKLNQLYSKTSATYQGVTIKESPLYYQAAEMYGDASFLCPTYDFARSLSEAGISVHLFLDNIHDPVEVANGYIVPHTWEVQAVWGPEYAANSVALSGANSYDAGKVNAAIVPVVQAYWTSFSQSLGDPNLLKEKGAPTWEQFGSGGFLSLETNATRMDQIDAELVKKCNFWASITSETYQ